MNRNDLILGLNGLSKYCNDPDLKGDRVARLTVEKAKFIIEEVLHTKHKQLENVPYPIFTPNGRGIHFMILIYIKYL